MNARCFIDLFDSTEFRGERRRIYGPVRLDAQLLGLDRDARVSVRVGDKAALLIERSGGDETTFGGGAELDTLESEGIRWLEVRPR